jgi:octaprenyl-diphosphate synthase
MTAARMFNAESLVDGRLMEDVRQAVESVNETLAREAKSEVEAVEAAAQLTLEAGGKRLRPILTLLSAQATGRPFDRRRVIQIGACLEMIHMASLIHDDVIDEAPTRRGKPTAAALAGNKRAILAGDVLLAKAMRILAIDGDLNLIRMVSDSVVEMIEGEVRETEVRDQFDLSLEDHLAILHLKTASFIACCCRAGAIIAGAPLAEAEALATYGGEMGLAFQISDDLLDYQGSTEKTGKRRAGDFYEGVATLPLILFRERANGTRARFQSLFGGAPSEQDIDDLLDSMTRTGALADSAAEARGRAERAVSVLSALPSTPARDMLESAAWFSVNRDA